MYTVCAAFGAGRPLQQPSRLKNTTQGNRAEANKVSWYEQFPAIRAVFGRQPATTRRFGDLYAFDVSLTNWIRLALAE